MKIAKLTWLHNGNYGSVLQALALQKFLEINGYDVTDINYSASMSTKLINWVRCKNSPKLFIGKFKETAKKNEYKEPEKFNIRQKRFDEFKNKNLKLTKLYRTPKELKELNNMYDIFVCGSDQIWSPALLNDTFYLSFVEDNKTKISYAPSLGVTNTTNAKKNKIKKMLESFNEVSVRETQAQEILKQITGKEYPVQVDPTMLLGSDIWKKYASEGKIVKEKYIFVYLLTENKLYIENIKQFANKHNYKVVIVPTAKGPFNTGFEEMPEAGPAEWLNLIENAEYVFTDSFHGCIFSTIFHKQHVIYKRFSDSSKTSENSRVYTLTKLLNTEERLIDENNLDKVFNLKDIDFNKTDSIIEEASKKSGEWLINAIQVNLKGE